MSQEASPQEASDDDSWSDEEPAAAPEYETLREAPEEFQKAPPEHVEEEESSEDEEVSDFFSAPPPPLPAGSSWRDVELSAAATERIQATAREWKLPTGNDRSEEKSKYEAIVQHLLRNGATMAS
eukprot:TRINITY_DN1033_c0_g1_i2.p1 TRINITY_DN1033_c0_g1~~TRINITY_DN1033_c0_g1_i2.p1  ORF type:complete len:125 (-),score=39.94 TRINITY_DN1033_c0_g1_i2:213-587(-)